MATSVPGLTFNDDGVEAPEEADILVGVQADINTAFGGDVNDQLSSPQGQLAQSQAAIIGSKNNDILYIANNIDPDRASGRWQDAIARIYFIGRLPGRATVVTGICRGLVGTVLPTGTAAQDTNGYIYYSTAEQTIGADGTVEVEFQAAQLGPIPCPIGNLSRIYVKVQGWDSVINESAGTIGANVESRADFEARRRASVAINANGSPQAIRAKVLDVDGVIDAYVLDNPTSSTVTVGPTNVDLVQHSVYVCVAGGNDQDIGQAIWDRKSLGCNYNGNQSVTIQDTVNYDRPYPEYEVKYQIASPTPTYFSVTLADNGALPSDISDLVKSAIISAFNGEDGGTRARIGATLYAGRFYAPVFNINSDVNIQSITLGLSSPGASQSVTYGIDQRPTVDANNITVTLV